MASTTEVTASPCMSAIPDVRPSEIPQRQKYSRGWNTKCKEGIKNVTSLLHIVDDVDSLKETFTLIQKCSNILSKAAQKEEGIILENPKPRPTSSKCSSDSGFKEIPKAQQRHPFSGRHGSRAETMKRQFKINLDVTKGVPVTKRAKNGLNIETKIVSIDADVNGNVTEMDAGTPDNCTSVSDDTDTTVPSSPHTPDKHDIDSGITAPCGVTTGNPESKVDADTKVPSDVTEATATLDNKTDADDIVLVDDTSPDPEKWVEIVHDDENIMLYPGNRDNILKQDGWLFDSEINAAQLLLKNQFPYIDGLEDPAIIDSHITPAISEFVQIVNTGNHWVCLSAVGCPPGQVNVFDSLGTVASPVAIDHACRMLVSPEKNAKMVNQKVQVQSNGND